MIIFASNNKGKIEESGTHEEMMAINGLYTKMFNTQRSLYEREDK